MANPNRSIIIESTNTLVTYIPDNAWIDVQSSDSSFENRNLGEPLSVSLKRLDHLGSFSFSFNGKVFPATRGSSIDVYGSNVSGKTQLSSLVCAVDGKAIMSNLTTFPQNNWRFCSSGNLGAGQHILSVIIHPAKGSPFFFDYLTFVPASDDQRSTGLIRMNQSDSSIIYSGNWSSQAVNTDSARLTNEKGASVKISFIGQQLTWYGVFSTLSPFAPAQANFSVDGGSSISFELAGLAHLNSFQSTSPLDNQLLFQTDDLSQGAHEVTVTYLGNSQQTDLGLQYLIIQNASENSLSLLTADANSTPPKATKINLPVLLVVISGVLFLFLFTTLIVMLVRERRRGRYAMSGATVKVPSLIVASPTHVNFPLLHHEPTMPDPYVTRSISTQISGMGSSASDPPEDMPWEDPSRGMSPPLRVPFLPTNPFDDEHSGLTDPVGTTPDVSRNITNTRPILRIRPLPNLLPGPGTAHGTNNDDSGMCLNNEVLQYETSSLTGSLPAYAP